jgi:hypothetical protein
VQTRLRNPPLGADWLTPRLAARLHDYERKAINCRTRLYGRHVGQFVCQSVPEEVLSLVVDHAEQCGRLEHGIVLYPGLTPGGWPNKDPDELRGPRPWWHWWIRLEDGTIVDAASSQFGQRSPLVIPPGHPMQKLYAPEGEEWLEEAGRYALVVPNPRGRTYPAWRSRGTPGRPNPDARRRELERQVAAGDMHAAEALLAARRREGELHWSLDGVLETVRAMPGLTRKEIAFWWGRDKSQGGNLLSSLSRDFLIHKDEAGRWWPGPDVRRSWESPYGCYPVDALSDAANRLPLRASNPRATLRALQGCLGMLKWAEGELQGVLSVEERRDLSSYVGQVQELADHVASGGRWHKAHQHKARRVRLMLNHLYHLLDSRVPTDTWCPDEPSANPRASWPHPRRRPGGRKDKLFTTRFATVRSRNSPSDLEPLAGEPGFFRWVSSDGTVVAQIHPQPGGVVVYDFGVDRGPHSQGHGVRALRELKERFGPVTVMDPVPGSVGFWDKMKDRGFVDRVEGFSRNPEEDLRELERRWAASGTHEDGVSYNRALRRAGRSSAYKPPYRKSEPTWRAVEAAQAALEEIAERYQEHKRPDRGVPEGAIPGVLYASSAGGLWAEGQGTHYGSYGSRKHLWTSLKIGSGFAVPPVSDWRERSRLRKLITDRIELEATEALLPFVEEFGGNVFTSHGTNYSTVGWGA